MGCPGRIACRAIATRSAADQRPSLSHTTHELEAGVSITALLGRVLFNEFGRLGWLHGVGLIASEAKLNQPTV